MPSSATDRFRTLAIAVGVEVVVSEFPEGTRTAIDAAAAVGCDVDAIVKSLVFMADDRPVLALVSGGNRASTSRCSPPRSVRTRCARPAPTRRAPRPATRSAGRRRSGHRATVSPARAHRPDAARRTTQVWAAAGTPSSVFPIDPAQLATVAGARQVAMTTGGDV
jgi:prolyl-tRNA editing enzyme YbaK/EbsC (Cys-tRNA(Pro) deacylase)